MIDDLRYTGLEIALSPGTFGSAESALQGIYLGCGIAALRPFFRPFGRLNGDAGSLRLQGGIVCEKRNFNSIWRSLLRALIRSFGLHPFAGVCETEAGDIAAAGILCVDFFV